MTTADILITAGRAMLGELKVIGWHNGHRDNQVMRAHSQGHGEVIVKVHRSAQRHHQEINAYRTWVAALGERSPRLIAINPDAPAIAVTALPGTPLAQLALPRAAEQDSHRQAGAILRTLHMAGPSKHDPEIKTFLAERGRYWIARASQQLGHDLSRELQHRLDQLITLPADTVTPCHLDFMPRNLLRNDDGTIRAIDFEHARYDLPARDLVRLATRIWPHRPDLEEAFLDGYGPIADLDRMIIHCCTAIDIASWKT